MWLMPANGHFDQQYIGILHVVMITPSTSSNSYAHTRWDFISLLNIGTTKLHWDSGTIENGTTSLAKEQKQEPKEQKEQSFARAVVPQFPGLYCGSLWQLHFLFFRAASTSLSPPFLCCGCWLLPSTSGSHIGTSGLGTVKGSKLFFRCTVKMQFVLN